MGRLKRYKLLDFNKIEDILRILVISKPLGKINIEGYPICTDTDRYENLYVNGLVCKSCGLKASFAAIEKNSDSKNKFHINFYGTRATDGKDLLLTKDHIYPRSLGGLDSINNYQTLCASCNGNKRNRTTMSVEEAIVNNYTTKEIQETLLALNLKKIELERVQKEYDRLSNKLRILIPKRDKSEFVEVDQCKKII